MPLMDAAQNELALQPGERWQALIDAEAILMDEMGMIRCIRTAGHLTRPGSPRVWITTTLSALNGFIAI